MLSVDLEIDGGSQGGRVGECLGGRQLSDLRLHVGGHLPQGRASWPTWEGGRK